MLQLSVDQSEAIRSLVKDLPGTEQRQDSGPALAFQNTHIYSLPFGEAVLNMSWAPRAISTAQELGILGLHFRPTGWDTK